MAITRSQMRRQLYRGGGIASVPRRQRYGIGDLVRKLIPNEIANVASKAAPFVAPFNPIAAGLMRGIGRYDKRGNLGDALKQGLATTALGAGTRFLGGAKNIMGGGITDFSLPFGAAGMDATTEFAASKNANIKKRFLDKFGKVGEFLKKGKDKFGEMGMLGQMGTIFAGGTGIALLADKLAGPKQADETVGEYMARRKSSVAEYLRFYYKRTNPLAGPEEVDNFVTTNTREYSASGGRVGYNMGSPREELDAGAQSITYEGNMNPNTQMAMSDPTLEDSRNEMSEMLFGKPLHELTPEELDLLNDYESQQAPQQSGIMQAMGPEPRPVIDEYGTPAGEEPIKAAKGGRAKYNMGTGSMGLPGAPRMAPDGIEYDMRENGGFQPLGAKEGKDDVKAVLAKNEFVMTADAVRAAGGGSIQKGAQRMYDTMKRLESRVA